MPSLIEAVRRYRQALLAMDAAETDRIIREYARIYQRLQVRQRELEQALRDMPERAELTEYQMERVRALRAQVEAEVTRFGGNLDGRLSTVSHNAVVAGSKGGTTLLDAAGYGAGINTLPTDAIETMLGFMADGSPLHGALKTRFGWEIGKRVEERLIDGIALGYAPRKVARQIVRETMGEGLTWAMTTARTALSWSYREAARAQYAANADIVVGWLWWSARDARVCLACLMMDNGTVHPVTETLNDHHNGRCVPVVISERTRQEQNGRTWFETRDPAMQQSMMGRQKYADWKANRFDLSELAGSYQDPVYGEMVREATLRTLRK